MSRNRMEQDDMGDNVVASQPLVACVDWNWSDVSFRRWCKCYSIQVTSDQIKRWGTCVDIVVHSFARWISGCAFTLTFRTFQLRSWLHPGRNWLDSNARVKVGLPIGLDIQQTTSHVKVGTVRIQQKLAFLLHKLPDLRNLSGSSVCNPHWAWLHDSNAILTLLGYSCCGRVCMEVLFWSKEAVVTVARRGGDKRYLPT